MNFWERMFLLDWFFSDDWLFGGDRKKSDGPSGFSTIIFIILVIMFILFIRTTFGKIVLFLIGGGIFTYFVVREFINDKNYSQLISVDKYLKLNDEQREIAYEDIVLKYLLSKIVNCNAKRNSGDKKIVYRRYYLQNAFLDYNTGIIYFEMRDSNSGNNCNPNQIYGFTLNGDDLFSIIEMSERIVRKLNETTINEMKNFLYSVKEEHIFKRFTEIEKLTPHKLKSYWCANPEKINSNCFSLIRNNDITNAFADTSKKYFEKSYEDYMKIKHMINNQEDGWEKELFWYHINTFFWYGPTIASQLLYDDVRCMSINSLLDWGKHNESIKTMIYSGWGAVCFFDVLPGKNKKYVDDTTLHIAKGVDLSILEISNPIEIIDNGIDLNNYTLGLCYYFKIYVQRDFGKAFYCFYKAVNEGVYNALPYLADCFRKGNGVKRDMQMAGNCYAYAVDISKEKSVSKDAVLFCNNEMDYLYVNKKWDRKAYDKDNFIEQLKLFSADKVEKFIPKRLRDIETFYTTYQEFIDKENYLFAGKTIRDIVESVVKDIIDNCLPEYTFDTTRVQIEKISDKGILDEHITSILFNLNQIGNKACHDGGAELDVDKVIIADKVVPDVIEAYRNLAS